MTHRIFVLALVSVSVFFGCQQDSATKQSLLPPLPLPVREHSCSPNGVSTAVDFDDAHINRSDRAVSGDLVAVIDARNDVAGYVLRVSRLYDATVIHEWFTDLPNISYPPQLWLGGHQLVVRQRTGDYFYDAEASYRVTRVDLDDKTDERLADIAIVAETFKDAAIPWVDVDAKGRIALDDGQRITVREVDSTTRVVADWPSTRDAYRTQLSLDGDELVYAFYTHPPGGVERLTLEKIDLTTGAVSTLTDSHAVGSTRIGLEHNTRYVLWNGEIFDRTTGAWRTLPFLAQGLSGDWVCGGETLQLYDLRTNTTLQLDLRALDECRLSEGRLLSSVYDTNTNEGAELCYDLQ